MFSFGIRTQGQPSTALSCDRGCTSTYCSCCTWLLYLVSCATLSGNIRTDYLKIWLPTRFLHVRTTWCIARKCPQPQGYARQQRALRTTAACTTTVCTTVCTTVWATVWGVVRIFHWVFTLERDVFSNELMDATDECMDRYSQVHVKVSAFFRVATVRPCTYSTPSTPCQSSFVLGGTEGFFCVVRCPATDRVDLSPHYE